MKINADELMELAIQIEKNGKEYFSAMAERSENPKVKQIFNFLVREEQSLFRHLLQRVVDRAGLGVGPLVRAPVLQVVAHLVAVGPPVLADGAEHEETA